MIRCFIQNWLQYYPQPKWLVTDPALYYVSEEFNYFLGRSGVGHVVSPAEAHWMMGPEERLIRKLKATAEKLLKEITALSPEDAFRLAVHAHNTTIQPNTGFAPFQWSRGGITEQVPIGVDPGKAFDKLLKQREFASVAYRKALAADHLSKLNNAVGRPRTKYETGALVMLWRVRKNGGKGAWTGPVRVIHLEGSTLWLASGASLLRAKLNQVRPCSRTEELAAIASGASVYKMPVTMETLLRGFRGRFYEDLAGETPPAAAQEDTGQGEVRNAPRPGDDRTFHPFPDEGANYAHCRGGPDRPARDLPQGGARDRSIREARRNSEQTLLFHAFGRPWKELVAVVWADAAQNNRPKKGSTVGIVGTIGPQEILSGERTPMNVVSWRSTKTPRESLGSNGSEVQAITIGEDLVYLIRAMWMEINGVNPVRGMMNQQIKANTRGALVMDSRGIFDTMTRNISALHGLRSSRAGYELTVAVRQALETDTILRWVAGTEMIADALTKTSARKVFLQLLSQRQEWRLVYDPGFTAGRKLNKREHEKRSQEMAANFLRGLQHFAEQQALPWVQEEPAAEEEEAMAQQLRNMTGVDSQVPVQSLYVVGCGQRRATISEVLAVGATMGSVVTCGLLTVAWHLRGLLETPFEDLSMEADDLVEEYNMQKQRRSLPARPAADVELGQLLGKSSKAVRRETCSRTSSGARRSGSEVREAGPGRRKPAAEAPTGPSSMLAQTRSATAGRGRGRAMAAPSRDSKWLLLEAALDRDQHTEDDGLGARAMPVSIGKVERFQGAAPSATTAAPPPTRCPPRPARYCCCWCLPALGNDTGLWVMPSWVAEDNYDIFTLLRGLFGSRGFIDPRLRLIATARGRSVVTAGNLKRHEVLFQVPLKSMLRRKLPWREVPLFKASRKDLSEDEEIILFLAALRKFGVYSEWYRYLRTLPLEEASTPVTWKPSEIHALRGTPAHWEARTLRRQLSALCERFTEQFVCEELRWAASHYWSRAVAVVGASPKAFRALIPGVDLLNFDSGAQNYFRMAGKSIVYIAGKDYTAGEEILDSYGGGKNDTNLLVHYGFLAEGPEDAAPPTCLLGRLALSGRRAEHIIRESSCNRCRALCLWSSGGPAMTIKYSRESKNPSKACKAQGVDLRVHYKNTYETAQAIKGMTLTNAKQYLLDVCEKKRCIPFRKYTGCIGRTPQAKEFKMTQGRWPVKSAKIVLGLLRNAEANAEFKNLETEKLVVEHVQVNAAQQGRRRTYRAHGRIGPYMNCPCHVELILSEPLDGVEKADEEVKPKKFTRKQFAKLRLKVGGDQDPKKLRRLWFRAAAPLVAAMTIKYSRESKNPSKACKAQGVDLRVTLGCSL
eukprot:s126_g13.t4